MLNMKEFELLLVIIVVTFIISLTFNQLSHIIQIHDTQYTFLERFYTGRFIIKNITETKPYANGICNLTQDFIYLFNQTNFSNYLKKYKIKYPVWMRIEYVNGTVIDEVGGFGKDYVEFRRVCSINNSLIVLRLRI